MSPNILLLVLVALTALGWFVGRAKARALYTGKGSLHSLPAHHATHLALWILIPALAGWLIWSIVSPGLVHSAIMLDPAAATLPAMEMERDSIISEAFQLASDPAATAFNPAAEGLVEPIRAATMKFNLIGAALVGRSAAVLGHDLHRRDHRDDRGDPAGSDERDLPDAICQRAGAALDEADAGDSRRHSDGGLRLFRRADCRADGARFAAALGMDNPSTESALAAGLVMGVMIIPFVSSMADDSIAAVPQAMRDGSLAMGATKSETIKKVLIPAALPGIVAGVMLAVSRAIGETMIVVMAAGAAANLSPIRFESMTTVTLPDRPAADRRSGVRQPQDAVGLRAGAGPVRGHAGAQHRRAARRQALPGSL
jgi:hypothetical protein